MSTTSKSLPLIRPSVARSWLAQPRDGAPDTNQAEPLSATSAPRCFLAVVAVAALVSAALWTYGLVDVLRSDYPVASLVGYQRRALLILGTLGIGALVVVSGSGLAYARTAAKAAIAGVIAGSVCAIPVWVVWIDLWEVFTGSK